MKLKEGDILICKKKCRIPIGQEATIKFFIANEVHMEWFIEEGYNDDGYIPHNQIKDYFYTEKELRKIKLEKIANEIR